LEDKEKTLSSGYLYICTKHAIKQSGRTLATVVAAASVASANMHEIHAIS
jgi:hypothetical protein